MRTVRLTWKRLFIVALAAALALVPAITALARVGSWRGRRIVSVGPNKWHPASALGAT